jgi:hypothetical protein
MKKSKQSPTVEVVGTTSEKSPVAETCDWSLTNHKLPAKEPLTRDWSLSTYLPEVAVRELCRQDWIAHYAYIPHDKDVYEDGNAKTLHIHVLLRLVQRMSFKALERRIKRFTYEYCFEHNIDEQNTFLERMQDPDGAFRYLTHSTKEARADGKYEYEISDIRSDNIGYWRGDYTTGQAEKQNTALDIVTDIEAGLTERQLLVRYGREYLINRSRYREFIGHMQDEEKPLCIMYDEETGEVVKSNKVLSAVQRRIEETKHRLALLAELEKELKE